MKKVLMIRHMKKKNVGLITQEINLADGQSDVLVKMRN